MNESNRNSGVQATQSGTASRQHQCPTVRYAELFGLKHLGANYKTTTVPEAIGYLAIGWALTSRLYEAEIPTAGETKCLGAACFRWAFLIGAGLSASGVAVSVVLARRAPGKLARALPVN